MNDGNPGCLFDFGRGLVCDAGQTYLGLRDFFLSFDEHGSDLFKAVKPVGRIAE